METISKDQQIQSQAETIESLSARVENLSNELERCLGETQNTELTLVKQRRDEPLRHRIYVAITSLFVPVQVYDVRKNDDKLIYQPWWYVRDYLFELDAFKDKWSRESFRNAILMLNDIVQGTEGKVSEIEDKMESCETGHRLFGHISDLDNKRLNEAAKELTHAISTMIKIYPTNQDMQATFSIEGLFDCLSVMRAVIFYQGMWNAAEPVEEE